MTVSGGQFAEPGAQPRPSTRVVRLRLLWRTVHLWLGLSFGLVLALVGASGALLVLAEPMVEAELAPLLADAPAPAPQAEWAPLDTWLANTRAAYPELDRLEGAWAPRTIPVPLDLPAIVAEVDLEGGGHGHGVVPIDPSTGRPVGYFLAEDLLAIQILLFHINLLTGDVGAWVVAVAGMLFLVMAATGLWLWWPKPRLRLWWQALTFRRQAGRRTLWLNLHNVPTIWLFLPLALVVVTGVYMTRPDWVRPVLAAVSEIREPDDALASSPPGTCGRPLGLDAAVALARQRVPGDTELRFASLPHQPGDTILVSLTAPGADPRAQASEFWIDSECPKILFWRTRGELTASELAISWAWPIHANVGLGGAGQVVVFGTGIALPLLYVTGLVLWLRRRATRRSASC